MSIGPLTEQQCRRARELQWILLDVDGVLTDGSLLYSSEGETLKRFNVKDGMAIKLAQRANLPVGILSGRASGPLSTRAAELGIELVYCGRVDKQTALQEIVAQTGVQPEYFAYFGDDLPDLPVISRVGLSLAPADAVSEVLARVDRVLDRPGGHGAVREGIELILRARGQWPDYWPHP